MIDDSELHVLRDAADDAYFDRIFDLIEGEFLFEKEPERSEKRTLAKDWLAERWIGVKTAICANRDAVKNMSFEDYVKHIIAIVAPLITNRPGLAAATVAALIATWCYRNGLNNLCKDPPAQVHNQA